MLDFQWAVQADKIKLINPLGTVAVCCLWTPVSYLEKRWLEVAPEILAADSPLCLLGGLYGGGLKIMLRNLHHNPQIDTVILLGKDFSGVVEHVVNFFQGKVEISEQKNVYVFADGKQRELAKLVIAGAKTSHSLDSLIRPDMFTPPPQILDWSKELERDYSMRLAKFLQTYQPRTPASSERPAKVPLPRPVTTTFPSELAGHVIVAETIVEAWDKLLFRLARFGPLVRLRNGKERNELLTVKAIIKNPGHYTSADLTNHNLPEDKILAYQADLLNPGLEEGGASYTYGNRLGKYFGLNLLNRVIEDLALNLDSRHSYLTLWDNLKDPIGHDTPCLVSLFFRKIESVTHLTATFRTHNGAKAWPINCFGLWGLLKHVCQKANSHPKRTEPQDLTPGQLIVVSQSISLNPSELTDVADLLASYQNQAHKIVTDPNGYFKLALDQENKEVVAWQFNHEDELIAEYRSKTASQMAQELVGHLAISDIGHALYLGGQLERAFYCLAKNLPYTQDKTTLP
ncbi:MAG: DUF4346 domain-containing protein [Deltaproteobacteria bacterium]|jgi:thymidylate synthase|nr:DUF4346 domain-containing protein [Deltaproteobacteria bacterium]